MNPAQQIATALSPYMDPAYAALVGTVGFIVGLLVISGLIAVAVCGPDKGEQP